MDYFDPLVFLQNICTHVYDIGNIVFHKVFQTPSAPEQPHIPLDANICIYGAIFLVGIAFWLSHMYYDAYLLSRNCKVVFTWTDEPKQVGETVGFAIMFYQLDGTPHNEAMLIELIEKVQISIRVKCNETVPHRIRPCLEDGNYVTMAEFEVNTAGIYEICLKYESFSLAESPFFKVFLPGVVDPSKSYVEKPANNLIVSTPWTSTSLDIVVVDKNENRCRMEDIEFDKFQFFVSLNEEVSSRRDDEVIGDFIYSFDKLECEGNFKVYFDMKIKIPGVYNARIVYDNCLLANGFFSIISITTEEDRLVNRVLNCEKGDNPCYPNVKAQLIEVGTDKYDIPLDIFLEVTPVNLTIQQIYWNVLTSKLFMFPISSRTKLRMISLCPLSESYVFSVSDGMQKSVTLQMASSESRIILILFAHFMTSKTGQMTYFEDKEKFFYCTLSKSLPETRFCYHVVSVTRNQIIKSSYSETRYFTAIDWRKSFVVSFLGENANEGDGIKDWLLTLCDAFFEDDRPNSMFISTGGSHLVHPNCSLFRSKRYPVEYYNFAGKIVAKCLIESSTNETFRGMILARFTRSFLAQLVGRLISYKHFESDNPELYSGTVSCILKSDMTMAKLTFTEPIYDHNGMFIKNVDIIPNGSVRNVDNDNKEEYLNALANHQLKNKVEEEVAAFRDGLHSLVPEHLLSIFEENEIELLMCGNTKFDIDDLKKNHVTGGSITNIRQQGRILDWLWKSLKKMNPEEKGRFLQFSTGSCFLPRGGFKDLIPHFKILLSESMGQMPSANKYLHQLILSDHSSIEDFEETLLKAIRQDTGR